MKLFVVVFVNDILCIKIYFVFVKFFYGLLFFWIGLVGVEFIELLLGDFLKLKFNRLIWLSELFICDCDGGWDILFEGGVENVCGNILFEGGGNFIFFGGGGRNILELFFFGRGLEDVVLDFIYFLVFL